MLSSSEEAVTQAQPEAHSYPRQCDDTTHGATDRFEPIEAGGSVTRTRGPLPRFGHEYAKLSSGMAHPRLHRVDWALNDCRNLLTRATQTVGQHEHEALLDRQSFNSPVENLPILRRILRDCAILLDCQHVRSCLLSAATKGFERTSIGDAEEPCRDSQCVAETAGALPDDQKHLIDHIYCLPVAVRDARDKSCETLMVSKVKLPESLPVCIANPAQKFTVENIVDIGGSCKRQRPGVYGPD
jgi:hypothetical protein